MIFIRLFNNKSEKKQKKIKLALEKLENTTKAEKQHKERHILF